MAQLTTRTTSAPGATAKGSPLTNAEVDQNFNRLNKAGPQIRPSLLLDFANSESVDNRITFTRASAATYYDANGVLQTVRNDKPRIDFDPVTGECKGLLIEEQRVNLLRSSENFSRWESYRNALRQGAAISPDGKRNAYRNSSASATIDGGGAYQTNTFTFASAATYTLSYFVKTDGAASLNIGFTDQAAGGYAGGSAIFDLTWQSSPTINGRSTSAAVVDVGGGWRRVSVTFTTKTSPDFHYVYFNITSPGTDANGIYIWGAQLELGAFATSYIPSPDTFTSRASSATYFDSTGVLRIAGVNQPRYGYGYDSASGKWVSQGLVLEAAATNMLTKQALFLSSTAYWTINSGGTTAPDGSSTATLLVNAVAPYNWYLTPFSVSSGTAYTFSIFAKAGSSTSFGAGFESGMGNFGIAYFTLSGDGVATPATSAVTASIAPVGNGWYRCTVTGTAASSSLTLNVNGTSAYVWGMQVEAGTVATSYIPTFGSTVTRAADVSSSAATTRSPDVGSMDFSRFAKPKGFTVAGEVEAFGLQAGRIVSLAPSTSDTSNIISVNFETSYFRTYQYANSALRFNTAGAGYVVNTFLKFALGVSVNAFSTVVNAYKESGTGPIEMQTDHLRIGSMNPGQYYLSGHIKRLAYYPQKLSDNELTALTL